MEIVAIRDDNRVKVMKARGKLGDEGWDMLFIIECSSEENARNINRALNKGIVAIHPMPNALNRNTEVK